VILILGVVGAVGYPEGVGVGILAAVIMFIHNYSRVEVVTHAFSGAELRSNVDRSVRELRLLREQGAQIYVLRLQGFISSARPTICSMRFERARPQRARSHSNL
jgi:SulP family sulfate permease